MLMKRKKDILKTVSLNGHQSLQETYEQTKYMTKKCKSYNEKVK